MRYLQWTLCALQFFLYCIGRQLEYDSVTQ